MDAYPPETREISTEMTSHREDDIPGQHSMDDLYKTANGDILDAMMQDSQEQGLIFPSGQLSGLDFKIVVPEIKEVKEGLLKNYMVYTIVLSVKDKEGNWTEYQVHRRYSDFDWFFENLCSKYSGYVIPMPPPKNFLTVVGQTDQDFVETRKRELILFLNKCIQHPFLRNTAELKIFLSDDKGFKELKDQAEKKKGFGFLSNITKMISGASKDTIFEHEELDEDDTNLFAFKQEFDRSKELLEKFSSSLTKYLDANKKQDDVLRPFMRGLESTLTQVSNATEFNEAFRKMAKSEKAQIDADLNRDIHLRLDRNLKSILSNIESANLAIKRRNLIAKEYDTLNTAIEVKRENGIYDKELTEMEEQFEIVAEKIEKTTKILLKDLALFEEGLQGDIASFFSEFVKRMEHYQRDLAQEADSIKESMKI